MWLVTRLRINDGATITIICCTNIHLSNPPIEELDTFIMWRCVIINYSPCVSSWLWGGRPARTQTRWAGRRGEAGRSRPSWEHKSPASRRSLQHQIIIIRVKSVNNSQTTEFSTKVELGSIKNYLTFDNVRNLKSKGYSKSHNVLTTSNGGGVWNVWSFMLTWAWFWFSRGEVEPRYWVRGRGDQVRVDTLPAPGGGARDGLAGAGGEGGELSFCLGQTEECRPVLENNH